ncbi:MAG: histidine--tRNA ligase [Deltaproteobacteria bacterium]|nr:histidine--tRNA ligase [Deltaproteobacteria bacterium]
MEGIRVIRGMRDILPAQSIWWRWMEGRLAEVCERFGYGELRTPLLEQTALFSRSIGEQTDIVEKEMYTFEDRDGSMLTLRPEGTASAVRAYIEHNMARAEPVSRWYYMGPMFRHERPQKGRYRQFSQMGAELLGVAGPAADVELIELMVESVAALGLTQTTLELNSLGCTACRPAYRDGLVTYLKQHDERLCEDCKRRMQQNPLRVLDCKQEACNKVAEGAPRMIDALCDDCAQHFFAVRGGLDGLKIPYHINHRMVRGLDYYGRTTFELLAEGLGSQNAVAAGGRYDGLVETLGGPKVPAVGFAAGLDRILLKLTESAEAPSQAPLIFIVSRGEAAWTKALQLMQGMRRAGLRVMSDVRQGSFKAQMKRADKDGARWVLLLAEDELKQGVVTVKDMQAGADSQDKQQQIAEDQLVDWLKKKTEEVEK